MNDPLYRRHLTTPVGALAVVATDRAIVAIEWDPGTPPATETGPGHRLLDLAAAQLDEYFVGGRTEFDLPLDPHGTVFQRAAWEVLRTIPYGGTITYGEQASRMGDPKRARAVGAANGRNPLPIVVPCHRVVGASGKLTGFAGGLANKAWLLDHERLTLLSGTA